MMPKNNGKGRNNDRFEEPYFWRYWKRTVLEDLDELRNIIIDCRLEQARLAVEQNELELRVAMLENIIYNNSIEIEIIEEEDDRGEEE
jgi:hypothetical protein